MLVLHVSVICLECGAKLVTRHQHDFQSCDCENKTSVDGGLSLFGRFGGKDLSKIQHFTITTEDNFETQRFYFERGTRGVNGDKPLHWIKLKDMTTEHIKAVIKYTPDSPYNEVYKKELKYRKNGEHRK